MIKRECAVMKSSEIHHASPDKDGKISSLLPFWTFMGSARMAVFLLVLCAFSSAIGTLLPQNQESGFYLKNYGHLWGGLILALHLDNLYYALWFIVLLALVAINLIISNMRRLESLRRGSRDVKAALGIPFFVSSPHSSKMKIPADCERAQASLENSLRSLRYSLVKEQEDQNVYYYAHKGIIRRWGSIVTHTGILVIFLGVIYGHLPGMGFMGMATLSTEGHEGTFELPGFSLKLLETGAKFNEQGRPTDFYSRVEVFEGGARVLEKTIRVNDPLEYRGIKFYQSSYGVQGFSLNVNEPDGKKERIPIGLGPGGIPQVTFPIQVGGTNIFLFLHHFYPDLAERDGKMVNLSMNYNNPGAHVYVFEDFSMDRRNQWKARGWVSAGAPLTYDGLVVEMGDLIRSTGLQYRKDPGVPLVWLGFVITTLGLFMSFYSVEKTIRIVLIPETGEMYVQTSSRLAEDFERELSAIKKISEE